MPHRSRSYRDMWIPCICVLVRIVLIFAFSLSSSLLSPFFWLLLCCRHRWHYLFAVNSVPRPMSDLTFFAVVILRGATTASIQFFPSEQLSKSRALHHFPRYSSVQFPSTSCSHKTNSFSLDKQLMTNLSPASMSWLYFIIIYFIMFISEWYWNPETIDVKYHWKKWLTPLNI